MNFSVIYFVCMFIDFVLNTKTLAYFARQNFVWNYQIRWEWSRLPVRPISPCQLPQLGSVLRCQVDWDSRSHRSTCKIALLVELWNPHWRGTSVVTCPSTPPPPHMLSQNSGYVAARNTKLLPHLNGDPRSKTQNLKPKSQISCYNGTMNIKLLTIATQNFYQTSMVNPDENPTPKAKFTRPQWWPQKHKPNSKTKTPN